MKYKLQDLIDITHFQHLQDRLNEIYSFPSAIIDNDGNVLTATGWQDVCTQFHRKNHDCLKECVASDRYIQSHLHEANPAVSYRCPHGLVDNATPIIIEGIHYGNFFTGQFFLEKPDLEFFRAQARAYGFAEGPYLEAVERVPIWSQQQLNSYLFFIKGLIAIISESGLKRLHEIETREKVEASEEERRAILQTAMDGFCLADTEGRVLEVNETYCRMSGYTAPELLTRRITDLDACAGVDAMAWHIQKVINQGEDRFESTHRRKDGSEFDVEVSIQFRPIRGGRFVLFLRDITERKRARDVLEQSEERLRESEAKLRVLFDTMAEGLALNEIVYDDKGEMVDYRILEVNRAYFSVADRASDQVIGGLATELYGMSTDDIKVFWRSHKDRTESVQTEMVSPLNQRTFLISTSPIVNHRFITSFIDVTERKQANDALRASEARLRAIIDTSPVPIAMNDEGQRITLLNGAFIKTFGYAKEDLQTLSGWWPLAYPDPDYRRWVAETWQTELERAKQTGVSFTPIEVTIRCKNGTSRTVLVSAASVGENWGGERLVLLYDITARKQSEQALLLRGAALEAAANAIVITDRQGTIEWANPAFVTLSGWSLAEALGKTPGELLKSGKHDAAFYRQMWETIFAGKVWQGEITNRRKDGELRTESMTITPVRDGQGKTSHFIAIKQDITAQKTIQAQLLQSQRVEIIGSLASGVAHDLNNILAPISLVGGLLKGKLADPNDQELLEMALSGSRRGTAIIKQLLTFSRGQQGERGAVQIRYLIREVFQMVRETFPRQIDLRQNVPTNLWPVVADSTQLHQVLLNLCVNARDAMHTGGCLTVGATNAMVSQGDAILPSDKPPGPYVVMEVSDTGHGIPAEIQHRIFDPFFTTKPIGEGTGLGLSTVLGIVQNHGGFIRLDSAPGKGSSFRVFLPAMPDGTDVTAETIPVSPVRPSSGQMILVVDDERNIREATRILLEREQFTVLTAINGEDALTQFLRHRDEIKLVLTDVMMPVMNGVTMVQALRKIAPSLKIIATSGLSDAAHGKELEALGVLDVLMKPCDSATLVEALHRRLAGT